MHMHSVQMPQPRMYVCGGQPRTKFHLWGRVGRRRRRGGLAGEAHEAADDVPQEVRIRQHLCVCMCVVRWAEFVY